MRHHTPSLIVVCTAAVAALGWLAMAYSSAVAQDLTGDYDLSLSADHGHERHSLTLRSTAGGKVSGVVRIDRGLGPEARVPSPDEKLHSIEFTGTWPDPRDAITFAVAAGSMRALRYEFRLYPIRTATIALAGVVTVRPAGMEGPVGVTGGALARKTR
jgi:hypothetical protein